MSGGSAFNHAVLRLGEAEIRKRANLINYAWREVLNAFREAAGHVDSSSLSLRVEERLRESAVQVTQMARSVEKSENAVLLSRLEEQLSRSASSLRASLEIFLAELKQSSGVPQERVVGESMEQPDRRRRVFVIGPIKEEGSEERRRSDKILAKLIRPAVLECGFEEPVRADGLSEPGSIADSVIQHLIEDELVVADLHDHNPNVFYELGVRHATGKPCILVAKKGDRIPFDIYSLRAIFLDIADIDSWEDSQKRMVGQINFIQLQSEPLGTAVTTALDRLSRRLRPLVSAPLSGGSSHPQELHHVSLVVSDLERSKSFYRDTLGLMPSDRERPTEELGFDGAWFKVADGQELHLVEKPQEKDEEFGYRNNHFALRVNDFREAEKRLKKRARSPRGILRCLLVSRSFISLIPMAMLLRSMQRSRRIGAPSQELPADA